MKKHNKSNILKKSTSSLLLISILTLLLPGFTYAKNSYFPDVKTDYVHLNAINYLKEQGVINGYPDGTFQPEKTINRAEALKIVLLARTKLNFPQNNSGITAKFPDVKTTDWFATYVDQATQMGIVKGYADGTFKPSNEITRAESLKMAMVGLVKSYQEVTVSSNPFEDVSKDMWYAGLVAYAVNKQFIEGDLDNKWQPEVKINRGEFAEIIYRSFYSEVNAQEKFPISLNWNYCNNYTVGYKVKVPSGWKVIPAGEQMILWKIDQINSQVSFARVYPESAVVIAAMDENPQKLSLDKYLETLEYGSTANKQVITLNGMPYASVFIEQSGLQDSYFQMPNGKILVLYAQVGDGANSVKLKEEVRYLLGSVKVSEASNPDENNCLGVNTVNSIENNSSAVTTTQNNGNANIKAEILGKILVPSQGDSALALLVDEILVETDSIGIGTGPVDYYFSSIVSVTLKIDRNSKTILAIKDGKITAF